MKKRHLFLTLTAIFLIFGAVVPAKTQTAVPDQNPDPSVAMFEDLEIAIGRARGIVLADPKNAEAWTDLARLLIKDGKLPEAEGALRAGLTVDPGHLSSLVLLGRLFRNEYRFEEAFAILKKAKAVALGAFDVFLLEAALAMDRMDFPEAEKIFASLAYKSPKSPKPLCGLAEVAYWENRYDDSLKYADQCLSLDPAFSRAYLFKSLIHRIRQENDLWAAAGRKAVEADPFDADARANLSNILMRGEKKMDEGYVEAKIALRIDPLNHPAHNYIGNGWSPKDYRDLKIGGPAETVAKVETLLREADEALLVRDFGPAAEKFGQILTLVPGTIPAMFGQGAIAYHQKNFDEAIRSFTAVLALDPDYGLAHYGLAQSLLRKKDRINVRFEEIEKAFAAKDAPEPPFLRDVFINYKDLGPELQKIIRFAVKPLRALLKTGRDNGSMFYITPFHKKQSEAPGMVQLKGERTFDLRLWDDVKGLGGKRAMSGEDWEQDVKYLRYNVVAHEFAHQVHRLLPKAIQAEIDALYAKAKTERKTLDFYSDTNVMEYFAVGVEAYVSEDKLADQKIAYGHTRRELLDRDPDLYRLIERLDGMETILPDGGR